MSRNYRKINYRVGKSQEPSMAKKQNQVSVTNGLQTVVRVLWDAKFPYPPFYLNFMPFVNLFSASINPLLGRNLEPLRGAKMTIKIFFERSGQKGGRQRVRKEGQQGLILKISCRPKAQEKQHFGKSLSVLLPRKCSDTNVEQLPPFHPPWGRTRGLSDSENHCRRKFLSFRRILTTVWKPWLTEPWRRTFSKNCMQDS